MQYISIKNLEACCELILLDKKEEIIDKAECQISPNRT